MTAEMAGPAALAEPDEEFPEWLRPPTEGFRADDLDRLTGLPPHTQLIDGSLVVRARQTVHHTRTNCLLEFGLARTAPARFKVRREMTVTIGPRQRPEPDIIVIHASGDIGMEETTYQSAAVVLAVEVVSPDSEVRDRERKPQLYAQAGFQYFWLVESADGRPVVYAYVLSPVSKKYELTGIFRDRLRLAVPFAIDIDLVGADEL